MSIKANLNYLSQREFWLTNLAVLVLKNIGGFLLAVLLKKTPTSGLIFVLQAIISFRKKARFYILSLISEHRFYGN